MKKFIIAGTFCAVALLGAGQYAFAETTETTPTTRAEMLAKVQDLMKLISDLQAKLAEARGEIKDLVADLKVGATGDDVTEIQEILATDPTIFGVKPTGYYGPLTEEAIKKFQVRYGLPETGIVDEATREVMRELKMEKKNGLIPPGLVKSDEVKDRIKARLQAKWGDCVWGPKFRASDCKKGHDMDDDEDGDDDDDNASSTPATRADAVRAIAAANEAISDLEDEIEQMEEDDADADDIEDAEDDLADAEEKLADARRALVRGKYDDAVEKAESAIEKATGEEDDEDDEDDDSDEDEDDDDDEDEDEDEDDDDEDED